MSRKTVIKVFAILMIIFLILGSFAAIAPYL
ncbi:hypothetical protein XF24_00778 [candidate division SR1 bacterium Aalborg_AAW-1]|nr:hypothetical protein XF24_00778 [candidate division SR1 bacterium Aalborg_AAW-1]